VPVAIKYNKVFVDAFWNSKKQTFLQHLYALMTSWAVVAEIWYMVSEAHRVYGGAGPSDGTNMAARRDRIRSTSSRASHPPPLPSGSKT
jgi:hypothetical protein